MRTVLLLALTAAGFLTANALVRATVPFPVDFALRGKAEYWAEHAEEFDAVFVGSSVTLYGLIPPVFEERLAERGYPGLRVFNFGVGGMAAHEADFTLGYVLEAEPKRLRWVFYEAPSWDPVIYYPDRGTPEPRLVYWHDAKQTWKALRSLAKTEQEVSADPDWKTATARRHLKLFFYQFTALGDGPRTARAWLGLDRNEVIPTAEQLESERGFIDLGELGQTDEVVAKGNVVLLENLEEYERDVQKIVRQNQARPKKVSNFDFEALDEQLDAITSRGYQPLYYVGPRPVATTKLRLLADLGYLPVFFAYNHPDLYPELYAVEHRWDRGHPNRRGAEVWTRRFADDFADWLDAQGTESDR